jgi:alanine-synthesizing transaminase
MFSKRTNWKLNPNKYTRALEEMRAADASIVDLTVSNPTQCGFHYDAEHILKAFQNRNALTYEPEAKGLLRAREEVARYYREDHGVVVDPQSVLLTTSTSDAYSYVFRLLCDPHDEILVPKPSYPLFDFLGELQDVSLVPYPLEYAHGWFVDFPSLVRAVTPRTRAVLMVHPNNPTGSYVRREQRQRLNELCRERGLALVVDEVFLDYGLTDERRESFITNDDALTFTLSGLSKVVALPQMKVAWLIMSGPEAAKKIALERLEIIADTYLSLNAPTQWAFGALLEQRRALRPQLLERIRQNWEFLRSSVRKEGGCELLDTEGGWYGVIRVKSAGSDEELAVEILRCTHTLVHPGHFYDFRTNGYLVVSLITPVSDFQQGIGSLTKFLAGVRA